MSIEVSPRVARDTAGTIQEAPAAPFRRGERHGEGAGDGRGPAITQLLADGICINVTLIFARPLRAGGGSLPRGAERRRGRTADDNMFSVASFFVSRVGGKSDKAIDARLAALPAEAPERAELKSYLGEAAIANARLAYARFEAVHGTPRFAALKARGAHVQRPLWASTSTKNPAYRDVLYVEELIGADTVNTMPPQTLIAFNDHGVVESRIHRRLEEARRLFERLPQLGVPIDALIDELEPEGVASFAKSYESPLRNV